MRLLQVAWRLTRGGGAPRVAREVLRGIDRARFEVHVCSVRPLYENDRLDELGSGLTFHSLELRGQPAWWQEGGVASGVARIVKEVRPDVVHLHSSDAPYALLPGFPNGSVPGKILEIHEPPQARRHAWLGGLIGWWMVKRLGYLPLVHSSPVLAEVARAYRVPSCAIRYIPLGVETSLYTRPETSRDAWRGQEGIPGDVPVVLYVARLVPTKNLPLFVEVARAVLQQVPDAIFMVAGQGPLQASLQVLIDGHGLQGRVRLLGFRERLIDVYHAADLFLSTSDYEGFGLAILEAMASGLPVVSTRVGGVVDLIEDGVTGRLCPVGDRESLAQATTDLLRDALARRHMGAGGQARAVRLFDVREMVRQYETLYVESVEAAARRS